MRHHERHIEIGAPCRIRWHDLEESVALVEGQDVLWGVPADPCNDFFRAPGIEPRDLVVSRYRASCGALEGHNPQRSEPPVDPLGLLTDGRAFTERKDTLPCDRVARTHALQERQKQGSSGG